MTHSETIFETTMKNDEHQRETCLPHLSTTENSQFDIFCSFSAIKLAQRSNFNFSCDFIFKKVGVFFRKKLLKK